jgi:hypothetical protein
MENEEKIAKLEELKIVLDKAWEISHGLMFEEVEYSKNWRILHDISHDLGFYESCLKHIKFE